MGNKTNSNKKTGQPEQNAVAQELLDKVVEKLKNEEPMAASLTDYIRMVQLTKELGEENPEEVRVRWGGPKETVGQAGPAAAAKETPAQGIAEKESATGENTPGKGGGPKSKK